MLDSLRSILSDVARLRKNFGHTLGNARIERGELLRLRDVPDDARIVLDIFGRGGCWFQARSRPATRPDDHGRICESGGNLPDIEAEVEAHSDDYESVWMFGCVHLPVGTNPENFSIPPGVDFVHIEAVTVAERPSYFVHHLEES